MKKRNYALILGILAIIIVTMLLPNVWAEPSIITISENDLGAGKKYNSLQEAIDSVDSGSTINLEEGAYGKNTKLTINKAITINGKGLKTEMWAQIEIKDTKNTDKVILSNFKSPMVEPENGLIFVDVKSPIDLEINKLTIQYMARNLDKEVMTLHLDSNSSTSKINILDSSLSGIYDGILIESSNNEININNSKVSGLVALSLKNGTDNQINATNNSEISGRAYTGSSYSTEAIQIINQKNLIFNVEDSKVNGVKTSGSKNTYTISFDGETTESESKSSNVKINFKGNSELKDEDPEGKIINFGKENNASQQNNIITVEPTVELTNDVNKKYLSSPDENYEVVGIFNKEGKLTIKAYTRGTVIPTSDLPVEIEGYRLDGLFNKYTEAEGYTEEFNKTDPVTKNMDIYPKYTKLVELTIGEKPPYIIDENQKLIDSNYSNEIKNSLQELKESEPGKTFVGFSDGTEIIAETIEDLMNKSFTEDTTITASFKIKVTLKYDNKIHQDFYEDNVPLGDEYAKLESVAKEGITGKKLKKIYDESDESKKPISKETIFTQDTVLIAVYNFEVKLGPDGDPIMVEENTSIGQEQYKKLKDQSQKEGKKVIYFENQDGEKIEENTKITKETILTPIYEWTVTFDGDSITFNTKSTDTTIKEKYDSWVTKATQEDKEFNHFENENGDTIESDTKIDKDMTLTAKYTINISVNGEKRYTIEENQSLNDKYDTLYNEFSEPTNKQFVGFAENTIDGEIITKETKFTKHTNLISKYQVNIKYKDITVTLDEGGTLSQNQLDAFTTKATEAFNDKTFKEFILDGKKIDTNTKFNENTTLEAKYTVTVKYDTEPEIVLDEGQSIGKTKYDELLSKASSTSKQFHSFKAQGSNEPIGPETPIHKNTVLEPSYKIDITYGEVTIAIDENSSLGKENYDKLLAEAKKGIEGIKTFQKLVDETGKEVTKDTIFSSNTTLQAIYTIIITFKNENTDIELEENKPLGNTNYNKLVELANKDISDKKLDRLVDSEGNTITENSTFTKNTDITPIYVVEVTFNNEDLNIKVEEGSKLGEDNYNKLKQKATEGITGKSLKKLVDSKENEITKESKITKNTDVKAIYSVNITYNNDIILTLDEGTELSKEDYKKLEESLKVEGKNIAGFKSNEKQITVGTKINSDTEITPLYTVTIIFEDVKITIDDNTTLTTEQKQKLIKAAKKDNKEFVNFLDNEIDFDLDSPITKNTTLTAKYNVIVKIGEETYTLEEGQTLNESSDIESIKNILEELKNSKEKEFSRFTDEKGNTIDLDTKINNNITITPKFKITITIDDEEFILEEGQSLNDLSKEDKDRLNKLKEKDGYKFVNFRDEEGNIIEENYKFEDDTKLKTEYKKNLVIINPQTLDNIVKYIWLEILGLISIISGIILHRKNKKHAN